MLQTSVSRELTRHFVAKWKAAHPGATVIVRDLSLTDIPPVSAAWIGANFSPAQTRTPEQRVVLHQSDALVSELHAADEYVFGVAMPIFASPRPSNSGSIKSRVPVSACRGAGVRMRERSRASAGFAVAS
jgi:FMN-dependent NADH-azoreductase